MIAHNALTHSWSLGFTSISRVEVQVGVLGSGNILEGVSWKDAYVFYQPLSSSARYTANGQVLKPNEGIFVIGPGAPFVMSTDGPHDWCSMLVPRLLFEDCNTITSEILDFESTRKWSFVADQNPALSTQMADCIRMALAASRIRKVNGITTFESELESKILHLARRIYCAGVRRQQKANRSKLNRSVILQKVQSYLCDSESGRSSVHGMSQYVGVSERTLRNVFSEFYSVGPKKFSVLARLRDVNRELKWSDPNNHSVTEIFTKYGFVELGRYAGIYRKTYGERPSDTLLRRE